MMQEVILALAKAAILVALEQPYSFDLPKALDEHPELKENGAVFVSLYTKPDKRLRGCIGSLEAYQPLYKDIISNAQSAAMKDSRFTPLQKEKLANITLEVSLLTKPQPLVYTSIETLRSDIRPYLDGVVLEYQGNRATYLPGVWEQLPTFDDFFTNLCTKAGLPSNCLKLHPAISTYQVTHYREKDE